MAKIQSNSAKFDAAAIEPPERVRESVGGAIVICPMIDRFAMLQAMPDEDVPPDSVDLESLDLGDMAAHARTATFATNWKSILITDGSIGVAVMLAGIAAVVWVGWAGWFLVALGLIYVGLVVRRFLQWRWIRQQAGLS